MTSNVSNSTAFNPNVTKVIYRSLRMVGAYNADGTPTAEQVEDAMDVLNCMLKAWQIDGFGSRICLHPKTVRESRKFYR
jgi:hypothetical protein